MASFPGCKLFFSIYIQNTNKKIVAEKQFTKKKLMARCVQNPRRPQNLDFFFHFFVIKMKNFKRLFCVVIFDNYCVN